MVLIKRGLYRLVSIAIDLAQGIVTTFGGGNGDPEALKGSGGAKRVRR